MNKTEIRRSVPFFLLVIALGLFFFAVGMLGIIDGTKINNEGVKNLFKSNVAQYVDLTVQILYLFCGLALILSLFKFLGIFCKWIILVVFIFWALSLFFDHFFGGFDWKDVQTFLEWLVALCRDLVILLGIWVVRSR